MTKASPSLKSISSQGAPFCSGGRFLEYLGMSRNTWEYLGKPWTTFGYFWIFLSGICSVRRWTISSHVDRGICEKGFSLEKDVCEGSKMQILKPESNIVLMQGGITKMQRKDSLSDSVFCVFNRFDLLSCYQPASHKAWGSIFWFFLRTKNNLCLYSWRMVQILVFCKPVSVSKCCHLFFGCPAVWNLPCSFKTIYFSQAMPRKFLNTQF